MKPFALARWRFTNCCGHSWGHPTTPHTPEGTPDGGSRRDFLKTAAAGVAGLAAFGSLPAKTAAQVRVFPPPPPAVSPIEGLIDFHNHCAPRSEEHTSELQSLAYLVCRLLLEKKKNSNSSSIYTH